MAGGGAEDRQVDDALGWFSLEDRERWMLMGAARGRIAVVGIKIEEQREELPVFILEHKVLADGSLALGVTSLGTRDPKVSRKLTNLNKLLPDIHVCIDSPCSVAGNFLCHCEQLELWHAPNFNGAERLGGTGRKRWAQLCMEIFGIDVYALEDVRAGRGAEEEEERASALREGGILGQGDRGKRQRDAHVSFVGDDVDFPIEVPGEDVRAEVAEVKKRREDGGDRGRGSAPKSPRQINSALEDL